jgi:protein involved in polysaccharide export with SLBB domain
MIKSRQWPGLALTILLFYAVGIPDLRAQSSYTLQPGDTVQVWMAQTEDLRGDGVVAPDGGISFPLAGHLRAEGLTLLELEAALRDRLKPYFKDTDLTLMLRPGREPIIYVIGEVTTPGAYPYRSHMTVLHALTVAGGLYRAAVLPADQDRSVIVGRQVSDGTLRMRELAAREARLLAELDGRRTLAAPGAKDDPLMAQEQMLLDARSRSVAMVDEAQQQAEVLNAQSRAALQEQVQAVTRRLELARDRLRSVSDLVEKGGVQSSQKNAHEANIAELDGQISRLSAEMVVLERAEIADAARYHAARQERQTQLLSELQAVRREQAETAARLNDSRRIMSIYGASAATAREQEQQAISYTIVRSRNGEAREIAASETSPLQPDDLVRVSVSAHTGQVGAAVQENPGASAAALASAAAATGGQEQ